MTDEITPKPKRKRKTQVAKQETTGPRPATVTVILPRNCKRTNLSVDALDSNTRDLALKTNILIDGDILLCRSMKVVSQGGEECLQITVRQGSFKFAETA
ncbi:MAG: hypothetical protein IPL32_20370 [Chloracidobacterium sp.]|nr:hypothetical protein [Chloracidobacterium sp.]MBK8468177.1 hypothetical protein [Chloracidobacterium sp.]